MQTEAAKHTYNLGDIVSAYGKTWAIQELDRSRIDGTPLYEVREWDGHRKVGPAGYISDAVIEAA